MKHCPECHSQYSDLTLNFCLQDGTPLVGGVKQSSVRTVAFSDPTTIRARLDTANAVGSANRTEIGESSAVETGTRPRNRAILAGLVGVLATIAMVAVVALPVLYRSSDNTTSASRPEGNLAVEQGNVRTIETVHNQLDEAPAISDSDSVKKEVAEFIATWEQAFESRSSDRVAAAYGAKVDYMGRDSIANTAIKNDVQQVFEKYGEIEIEITRLLIAVDAGGDAATAVFDKEWSYEARDSLNDGKAHVKIHLEKIAGQWKIVAERHLKTYHLEE